MLKDESHDKPTDVGRSSASVDYQNMTLDEAWVLYKENDDKVARAFIARAYAPMVAAIARRILRKRPAIFDYSDLVQCGTIGLLVAMERFDLDKNNKFSTYAPLRIKGEIIDSINQMDWTPRGVRDRIKLIINKTAEFENEHGYTPSDMELAAYVSLPLDKVREARLQYQKTHVNGYGLELVSDVAVNNAVPSQSIVGGAEESSEHFSNPHEITFESSDEEKLRLAMSETLDDIEKTVISMYYFERVTYAVMSKKLKISKLEIKDIISRSLQKIKVHMDAQDS